jgi:hypothetical protein
MIRSRPLDCVVAVGALAVLALSFAPWSWRLSGLGNAWQTGRILAVLILLVLGSAGLWVARTDRPARIGAAAGMVVAAVGLVVYVWTRSDVAYWSYSSPSASTSHGLLERRFGLYAGLVLIAALAIVMTGSVVRGLAGTRRLPRTGAVAVIIALAAVSVAPWWRSQGAAETVWGTSTVWSSALLGSAVATAVWVTLPRFRFGAAALGTLAVLVAVVPVPSVDTLPRMFANNGIFYGGSDGPITRDHLTVGEGAGPGYGLLLGFALMALVAVLMLAHIARRPVVRAS